MKSIHFVQTVDKKTTGLNNEEKCSKVQFSFQFVEVKTCLIAVLVEK